MMKSVMLAMVLVLAMVSVSLAGCPEECDGPYQTCMRICGQTTEAKSPEEAKCWNSCLRGVIGCQIRCEEKKRSEIEWPNDLMAQIVNPKDFKKSDPKPPMMMLASANCVCAECNKKCGTGHETWCSSYQKPNAQPLIENDPVAFHSEMNFDVLSYGCIEKDLQCTLNGTPCCAPYNCKGKFPNTYCQ
jgi:hypothetical protein